MILLICLCFVLTIISSIAIAIKKVQKNNLFSLNDFNVKNTLPLRGVLAILIVIHHWSKSEAATAAPSIVHQFSVWGNLVVAAFFFLSGYGIMRSFNENRDVYMNGFIGKRTLKILPPFLIVILLYLSYASIHQNCNAFWLFLSGQFHSSLINMWFVYLLFALYLLFFCSVHFFRGMKILLFFQLTAICAYSGFLYAFHLPNYWYISVFAFIVGEYWSIQEYWMKAIILKRPQISLWTSFAVLLLFDMTYLATESPLAIVVMCCILPLLIVEFVYFLNNLNSPVMNFLGTISYEIYLTHGVFIDLLSKGAIENIWTLFLAVLSISTVSAWILHYACNAMRKLI